MKTIVTTLAGLLLAAVTLQASTITAEAILIAVPNPEALALAAKSEVGSVSGTSLAELQKLVAENKARSAGMVSVTSASGSRASSSQGATKLDSGLANTENVVSGPLILHHGEAKITATINAKGGDLIYLGSFTEEGETVMAFLRLSLSGSGDSSN
jgi:hypothetical protein